MDLNLLQNAENFKLQHRRKKRWQQVVSVLGCIVVFCTVYALILPAITMEKDTICGYEEHQHSDACYEVSTVEPQPEILCTEDALIEAGVVLIHEHDELCCDYNGKRICSLEEIEEHAHNEVCYEEKRTLLCELEEDPGHSHAGACYAYHRGELICGSEEYEGHAHGDGCYDACEVLTCTLSEAPHAHDTSCYETVEELLCALPEDETHAHSADCYTYRENLTCTLPEEPHTHDSACYGTEKNLICETPEEAGHTHTDDCYLWTEELTCIEEERPAGHVHADACYLIEMVLACTKDEITLHEHDEDCVAPISDWTRFDENALYDEFGQPITLDEIEYDESGEPLQTLCELTCEMPVVMEHQHTDACVVPPEGEAHEVTTLVCELEEHVHSEACYPQEPEYICGLTEHSHVEDCWDAEGELICVETEHVHDAACLAAEGSEIPEVEYICGAGAHLHIDTCCDAAGNLTCELPEHVHDETCLPAEETACTCEQEEHIHTTLCLGSAGLPTCGLEEHTHDETCGVTAEPETEYVCGLAEHSHDDLCLDAEGDIACGIEAHAHDTACKTTEELIAAQSYICGLPEHAHTMLCRNEAGETVCGLEEHAHTDDCVDDRVLDIIVRIDALPSADEIDATMLAYEDAEDYEGLEEWYTGVCIQISEVYFDYTYLSEEQAAMVTNADKFMELEYIWSAQNLIDEITSDSPTENGYTSTRDFIELNLYDYKGNINTNYKANNEYPGFQWNGGAYYRDVDGDGNRDDYDRHQVDFIDFGNSMVTNFGYGSSNTSLANGYSVNRQNIGNQGGAINKLDLTYGVTNAPIGISTGSEVISRTLIDDTPNDGVDNKYPALKDGTSLSYLFKDGTYAIKQNETYSIDGLFKQDSSTGEYSYNSRENHAQFKDSNDTFVRYNQIITPNFIVYPFGNFLPFNDITDGSDATQVSKITKVGSSGYLQEVINDLWYADDYSTNATKQQLVAMLGEYRYNLRGNDDSTDATDPWATWSAKDAIVDYFTTSDSNADNPSSDTSPITTALLKKMYNIDFDVKTNFFFGMEMKMNFMQPKGGLTGPNGDQQMIFKFTGDDDVWVYIDDVLFLDLSGIHRHVGGEIDFVKGEVRYYKLEPENKGDIGTTAYKTYTFAQMLEAAEVDPTTVLNSNGTFKDYSTHSFNFYYMERGSGSSVCRINFNFPLLKKNSVTVTKENALYETDPETGEQEETNLTVLGSPDYYFNIVKQSGGLLVGANTTYKLLDSAGNQIGTGTTDEFGIFKIKSGQTAVFEDIPENAGTYYVQELIKDEDHAQYNDTVDINGTASQYNAKIDWSARSWADPILDERYGDNRDAYIGPEGVAWWGYSSQYTNADASHTFNFSALNGVKTEMLGKLSITKSVSDYNPLARGVAPQFTMHVLLGDTELPKGTPYTITYADGSTGADTVDTAGLVVVPAGATVTIENILSGTDFEVWEDEASAAGYTVSYSLNGVSVSGGKVTGTVNTDSMGVDQLVEVGVINSEGGDTAEIPVIKNLTNPDDKERTFNFRLVQVTDAAGTTEVAGTEQILPITLGANTGTADGSFSLVYPAVDYSESTTVYYKITEVVDESASAVITYDQTAWIVSVAVTRNTDGTVTAGTPTIVSPAEQTSVTFTNTITHYELPETGGMGTTHLYTLGGALLMTATLLLYRKYRRKGGAESA